MFKLHPSNDGRLHRGKPHRMGCIGFSESPAKVRISLQSEKKNRCFFEMKSC